MPSSRLAELARMAPSGERLVVDRSLIAALVVAARSGIHDLLRELMRRPVDRDSVLDPAFSTAGNELYLDRQAALSVKMAVGRSSRFATVACRSLFVSLRGGVMTVECFAVDQQRARYTHTVEIAPGEGIYCTDPSCAYRFSALGEPAVLAKQQFDRERPLRDYHHVFEMGEDHAAYQATIPFDFGTYKAVYGLGMAESLGRLTPVLARHRRTLLAGPTPFLWEAAKLLIRARNASCYEFLDALIAREDENFDRAARMTRDNIAEVIPRAN
ncbi:MAG: hypothetical protein AAGF11_37150 [Myxococcota bacterium]